MTYVYSVDHPILATPLVFESSWQRSDNLVKFTAVQYFESTEPFNKAVPCWIDEISNMTVTEEVEA